MYKKIFLFALVVTTTLAATDETLVEKTKGEDVVMAVVNKIHASNIFPEDYELLTRIAYVESKFGENANTYRDKYTGGIWQVDEENYKQSTNITVLKDKHDKIETYFKINWPTKTTWNDLLKPLYSGLAARLRLSIAEGQNKPIPQTLAEQAKYWNTYYNRRDDMWESNFTEAVKELENKTSSCKGKMDLLVLLDGSGSVGENAFKQSLGFVADLFGSYSSENVRKGFLEFGDTILEVFNLENKLTDAQIKSKVSGTKYLKENTNTNKGIVASVEMYKKTPERPGVPKVFTVFTDGASNRGGPGDRGGIPDIVKAKEANLTTYAIGIGTGINQKELNEIAYGDPSHVFSLTDFDALTEFFRRLNSETCSIPQKPELNETTSDLLAQNEKRYYDFSIPEDGLTIFLDTTNGQVEGYYSYTQKTPSSALNDGVLTGDETFIPRPSAPSTYADVPNVVIAIKGLKASNEYLILTQQGNLVVSESTTDSAVQNNLHWISVIVTFLLFSLNQLM